MKEWAGCRKEDCKLWDDDCCVVDECYYPKFEDEGRCYFEPKPRISVERYEAVKEFSILDLAVAGIDHSRINQLHEDLLHHDVAKCIAANAPISLLGAGPFIGDLLPDLENAGFIKRVVPAVKVGDWVVHTNGARGKVKDIYGGKARFIDHNRGSLTYAVEGLTVIPAPIWPEAK